MSIRLIALWGMVISLYYAKAQNTRLSLDLGGGVPISLVSVKGSFTTYGTVGIRYNILKEISVQGVLNVGTLSGTNKGGDFFTQTPEGKDNVNNYKGFSNSFWQYSLNGQVDLNRLFNMRHLFHRLNPYLVVGSGFMQSDVNASRIDDSKKNYRFQAFCGYGGLSLRYYLNPSLDLNLSSMLHMTQSYYLDGIYFDQNYDKFILNSLGISYKFGAKSQRQHIEWNNVILKERIYIPNIEKRNGQAIDEDGNYIIYSKDSINTIIAINKELKEENARQREELDVVKKEMQVLQSETDTMKNQMNSLNDAIKRLQQQNEDIIKRMNENPPVPAPVTPAPAVVPVPQPKTIPAPSNTYVPSEPVVVPVPENKEPLPVQKETDEEPVVPKQIVNNPVKAEKPAVQEPAAPAIVAKPEKAAQPRPQPRPKAVNREQPKEAETPVVALPETGLNEISGVSAPIEKYNVVVGAYVGTKYAYIFRDKMREKGYEAAIFKSDANSKIYRVCVFTTSDKSEAIETMNQVRKDVDPKAWIHVYTEK